MAINVAPPTIKRGELENASTSDGKRISSSSRVDLLLNTLRMLIVNTSNTPVRTTKTQAPKNTRIPP